MTITLDELTTAEPKRDRYGRPLIVPRGGGKPKPHIRPSTLADTLDDRYNLELWKLTTAGDGWVARPDLLALFASTPKDDKSKRRKIVADAIEAGKGSAGANMGTAVHAAIESYNRTGEYVPMFEAHVKAYRRLLDEAGLRVDTDNVERFCVQPDIPAAGTFDMRVTDGIDAYIGDLKTGSTVEWSAKAFAVQLCCYADADSYYDWATETHSDPAPVNRSKGVIVHLPADDPESGAVYWLDLDAGREALEHALWVRRWRNRKGLLTPVTVKDDPPAVTDAAATMTEDELVDTLKRRPRRAQGGTTTGTVETPSRESRPARIEPASNHVERPDEGGPAEVGDYARIQADGKALSKDALGLVLRWRAEPKGHWRWNTAGDDGRVSVRRVAITEVAMALAEFVEETHYDRVATGMDDDFTARAALEEVLGDDVQSHPVGELLARLTVDECERMMEVLS